MSAWKTAWSPGFTWANITVEIAAMPKPKTSAASPCSNAAILASMTRWLGVLN
jgi:hypothetical protein